MQGANVLFPQVSRTNLLVNNKPYEKPKQLRISLLFWRYILGHTLSQEETDRAYNISLKFEKDMLFKTAELGSTYVGERKLCEKLFKIGLFNLLVNYKYVVEFFLIPEIFDLLYWDDMDGGYASDKQEQVATLWVRTRNGFVGPPIERFKEYFLDIKNGTFKLFRIQDPLVKAVLKSTKFKSSFFKYVAYFDKNKETPLSNLSFLNYLETQIITLNENDLQRIVDARNEVSITTLDKYILDYFFLLHKGESPLRFAEKVPTFVRKDYEEYQRISIDVLRTSLQTRMTLVLNTSSLNVERMEIDAGKYELSKDGDYYVETEITVGNVVYTSKTHICSISSLFYCKRCKTFVSKYVFENGICKWEIQYYKLIEWRKEPDESKKESPSPLNFHCKNPKMIRLIGKHSRDKFFPDVSRLDGTIRSGYETEFKTLVENNSLDDERFKEIYISLLTL